MGFGESESSPQRALVEMPEQNKARRSNEQMKLPELEARQGRIKGKPG